jgi:hypothetical protein
MQTLPLFRSSKPIGALAIALCVSIGTLAAPLQASAQSRVSSDMQQVMGSVVRGVSEASSGRNPVSEVPLALSVGGVVLTVVAVSASVEGTVYVFERASDGARVSVEVASRGAGAASLAVGTAVNVAVIASGVVLSVAGEVIAFVPNAAGRALLHNERLS